MIIVTGGAGLIGSNIVKALNESGINDILVVDNLKNGKKFENLVDLDITDYMDRDDFLVQLMSGEEFGPIEAVFHQGACSSTTESDGKYMMLNNYEYSKELLHYCLERQIPLLYASSAAIYGDRSDNFIEEKQFESALNVYGYSKQQFDNYVRRLWEDAEAHGETLSQITALRYFSVYGPREQHKGELASLPFHLNQQLSAGKVPTIVAGSEHFKRDFVHVSDVVAVNLWFLQNGISGIYNVGTGQAESLGDMTKAVVQSHGKSEIEAIDDPALLKEAYPEFTQADLTKLRAAGCQHQFKSVAEGIAEYMPMINK